MKITSMDEFIKARKDGKSIMLGSVWVQDRMIKKISMIEMDKLIKKGAIYAESQ